MTNINKWIKDNNLTNWSTDALYWRLTSLKEAQRYAYYVRHTDKRYKKAMRILKAKRRAIEQELLNRGKR